MRRYRIRGRRAQRAYTRGLLDGAFAQRAHDVHVIRFRQRQPGIAYDGLEGMARSVGVRASLPLENDGEPWPERLVAGGNHSGARVRFAVFSPN